MSMNEPLKLRFIHRFRNGTLCELTLKMVDGVPRPHHLWSGALPKFKGERCAWELSCWETIANRTGIENYYAVVLASGELKAWVCRPGCKPQRCLPKEAFDNAGAVGFAQNSNLEGKSWPL